MESPPYIFRDITHFSVGNVEKHDPRVDGIMKVTLEIESKILPGTYPLVLVKPFPPFSKPGKELEKLASLRAEEIQSIWAFRRPDGKPGPRIEIRGKAPGANVFISCDAIEGVPDWDEKQTACNRAVDSGTQ